MRRDNQINTLSKYEQKIEKEVIEEILNVFKDEEGSIRKFNRKVFVSKQLVDSLKFRISILKYTTNWFKNILTYEIYIDETMDKCSLKIGFSNENSYFDFENLDLLLKKIIEDINNKSYKQRGVE